MLVPRCLLAVLAASALSGSAGAAFITQSGSVGTGVPASSIGPYNGQYVVSVQKFDPTLGTLQAVTVSFSNLRTGDATVITVDNEAATTIVFQVNQRATFAVSAGASTGASVSGLGAVNSTVYGAGPDSDGVPDFAGNDAAFNVAAAGAQLTSSAVKQVEASTFANYMGTGRVNVGLNYTVGLDFQYLSPTPSVAPAYRFNNPVTIQGDYQVVYTYAAVPEPASFALCGLAGFVAGPLVLLRRRSSPRDAQRAG